MIRQYGGEPVSLDKALSDADAVLIINDHPDYRALRVDAMLSARRSRCWSTTPGGSSTRPAVTAAGVRYAGLGYRAAARR